MNDNPNEQQSVADPTSQKRHGHDHTEILNLLATVICTLGILAGVVLLLRGRTILSTLIIGIAAIIMLLIGVLTFRSASKRNPTEKLQAWFSLLPGVLGVSVVLWIITDDFVLRPIEAPAERTRCQPNLRAIGQVLLLYTQDEAGK